MKVYKHRKVIKAAPAEVIDKPKEKIWWYKGLRRLMPAPWVYKIPKLDYILEYTKKIT